jgi:hypothetical protein
LKVDFQGTRVTSGRGLFLVRELDERLGLEKLIEEHVGRAKMSRRNSVDLPGACSGGKFDVSRAGKAYNV